MRTTQHEQITASTGINVDVGLVQLLEVIWSKRFTTLYSCQGDNEKLAYILFLKNSSTDDTKVTQLIKNSGFNIFKDQLVYDYSNPVSVLTYEDNTLMTAKLRGQNDIQLERDPDGKKFCIRFQPKIIPLLEAIFRKDEI